MSIYNRKGDILYKQGSSTSLQLTGFISLLFMLVVIVCGSMVIYDLIHKTNNVPSRISRLLVIGDRIYTTNNDISQCLLTVGSSKACIIQDINLIKHQIEQLPWVKEVDVRKQWPDALKIYLVEYRPIARWNDDLMVDNSGRSFSIPDNKIDDQIIMPMLYGPKGSEQNVIAGYYTINALLAAAKFQLKSLRMSTRKSWQLTLQDDIRLDLGRSDLSQRLQRFITIYPIINQHGRLSNKRINYIDLRYDSGVAVGWYPTSIDNAGNNTQKQSKIKIQVQAK